MNTFVNAIKNNNVIRLQTNEKSLKKAYIVVYAKPHITKATPVRLFTVIARTTRACSLHARLAGGQQGQEKIRRTITKFMWSKEKSIAGVRSNVK